MNTQRRQHRRDRPSARPTRMGIKSTARALVSFLLLEVFFHSELVLANEKLLEGVKAVLLVEDEHVFSAQKNCIFSFYRISEEPKNAKNKGEMSRKNVYGFYYCIARSLFKASLAGICFMLLFASQTTISCPCRAFSSSMRRSARSRPYCSFSPNSAISLFDIGLQLSE